MPGIRFEPPGFDASEAEKTGKNKKKGLRRVIVNVAVVSFAVTATVIGVRSYLRYSAQQEQYRQSKRIYNDIEAFVFVEETDPSEQQTENETVSQETAAPNPLRKQSINFEKLRAVNKDAFGWIAVHNTSINYPVVQAYDDTQYWLQHAFDGQPSSNGSIYRDYREAEETQNIILYGHRMNDGSMFHDLDCLDTIDGYNNGVYISILREDGTYIYRIMAAGHYLAADNDLYRLNFDDSFTVEDYKEYLRQNAAYTTEWIDFAEEESRFLTLSTCVDTSKNPYRRIISCVLEKIE